MAFRFLKNISQALRGDESPTEEGIGDKRVLLKLSMKDDDLIREIDKDILTARPIYDEMQQVQDENEKYYLGTQLDRKYFSYELPTDQNILYRNLETLISIITAKRREPIVLPAQGNDESRELAEHNQNFLSWKWSEQDMSVKFEDWVRHSMIYRIGVLKVRWNLETDDFEVENIRPQKVMVVEGTGKDEKGEKAIVEFREDIMADLIRMYPTSKDKLIKAFGKQKGTKVKYIEYWTNEFTVMKVNKIVLDKKKNPNWNWDETPEQREKNLKKLKERWIEKTRDEKLTNLLLNYFNEPRKPYVILSLKSLNKSIYADTSDFDQGKRGQDIVNKRKRHIDRAAVHSLGRTVVSGDVIDKKEAKKIIANPNSPLWLKRGRPQDAIQHIAPQPVSPVLLEDLRDTKAELDNTMGVHGTSRGERGPQETATGRTILREGDMGRADLAVRRIDKKLELLYAWMCQMAKVYYTDDHWIKWLGGEGAASYLKFSRDDIEDGQEIVVKSEMTADKATQRQMADQRMQMGIIDPLTYLEKLDESNPKEKARRLVFYLTDPKLYLQQFLIDENTEGAENDPLGKAKQEQSQLLEGEEVPPFTGVTQDHLQEHIKFGKSSELKGADVTVEDNFMRHLQQESELLKGQTQV